MPDSPPRYQRFFAELKRRRVFRVMAVYGVVGFVLLQVAELAVPALLLPDWIFRLVALLLLVGLPIAVILAWAFEVTPAGVRRTDPASPQEIEAIVALPASRRWLAGLLALAGLAVLLAGAWYAGRRSGMDGIGSTAARVASEGLEGAPRTPGNSSVVAILPFSVSGGQEYLYLGTGMVDLLSTRLDGVGSIRTVPARAVLGLVRQQGPGDPDREVAQGIAATLSAGLFVTGRVVESGGRLSVAAALYGVGSAEPIARASIDGDDGELFQMVDRLTTQLVAGLEDSPAGRVRQTAALTTNSLPALQAYLGGEELFRRGRFTEALEAFERATAIDSTFALAHYRVSIAREWGGYPDTREAAAVAARHAERLSDRDRLLVEAAVAWRDGRGEEAEDLYRTILGRWPDDVEAWLELAEVLNHYGPLRGRSISESRRAFEAVVRFEPEHLPALWHLARIAAVEGRMAEADSLVDRIRSLAPGGDRTLELLAMQAAGRRPEAWAAVLDSLQSAQDMTRWLTTWNVSVYAQKPDHARETLRALTDPSRSREVRSTGHLLDAFLALARGRPSGSRQAVIRLESLDPGLVLAHRAVLALLPFVDTSPDTLEAHLRAVEAWQPPDGCVSAHPIRYFEPATCFRPLIREYLLGVLESRLGRADRAMPHVVALEGEAVAGSDNSRHAVELLAGVRAEVALAHGDTVTALDALEAAPGHIDYVDATTSIFYSHSPERFRRARLLEALGRDEEAVRWYGSFDELSPYDLALLGPAQLRAGRILEAAGRNEEAVVRYARAAELLEGGEGEYGEWGREARQALERLGASLERGA